MLYINDSDYSIAHTSIDLQQFCMHLRILNCDSPFLHVVTGLGGELLDVVQFCVMLF
jgi:hypothetical protein